jgi:tetratricopeptide (TPR) repeat protein
LMNPAALPKRFFWDRTKLITIISLAVITVVGAWLRFSDLGTKSLWMDEYWQAFFLYTFRLDELLHVTLIREWEPPLIYLFSFPLIKIFGFSEFTLRLPSCLAGIATIPVAYLLGNKVAGRRVGLVSALIFCLHPTAFWYSQDARPYALLIFCTALVLWLFVRDVRKSRYSPAYSIALIALAISHYFAIVPGMFLLAIDLYKQIFTKDKRRWACLLWEYLPYVMVTAILLYLRLSNFNLTPDVMSGPAPIAGLNNWEMIYANLVFGYRRMHLLAWAFALIGMALIWFRRRELTVHFLLGGTIGTAALMLLCVYIFRFRYFYYLMPEMVLFIAMALVWLLDRILGLLKLQAKVWNLVGLMLISAGLILWTYEPLVTRIHGEKMDYRALAMLFGQEIDHTGVILIPVGDLGLTTYPPYCRGAINSFPVPNRPERLYTPRILRLMSKNPRGLAVFPTEEQLAVTMDILKARDYRSCARLYVFGFHVLAWDEKLDSESKIMDHIEKMFKPISSLNVLMSKAYYFEDLGYYGSALDFTNQALHDNPDSSEIFATKARILRKLGDDKQAEICEKRAWMIDVLLKNSTYVD